MGLPRFLEVLKLSATGNTFVLCDMRKPQNFWVKDRLKEAAKKLSLEFASDGLAVIHQASRKDTGGDKGAISLKFFNPDGSQAFCGNGTRAAGFYEIGIVDGKKEGAVHIQTAAGPRKVVVCKGEAKLFGIFYPKMKRAVEMRLGSLGPTMVYSVDSGCPHAVLFVDRLDKVEVPEIAPIIRHHTLFKPHGTNVDFMQVDNGILKVRTYERGVERETKSCGSGVIACAALARSLGRIKKDSCMVKTKGGSLKVLFTLQKNGSAGIKGCSLILEGKVELLFHGKAYFS